MKARVKLKIKCPKCGNTDISLLEIWEGHSISWQVTDGYINTDDGNLEPGNPYKVKGSCICGHEWIIRNASQIDDISYNFV